MLELLNPDRFGLKLANELVFLEAEARFFIIQSIN